jgi:hypothetical protein
VAADINGDGRPDLISANAYSSSLSVLTNAAPYGSTTIPVIITQPMNVTVNAGGTASFAISATGSAPLNYFWQRNGMDIAGATNSTYTTNNVQLTDSGSQFSCVVSNAYGTTNSQAATLTVVPVPPAIIQQPTNVTVNAGQPATFSVTATGTAPLYYQWQFGGVAIAGATSSSYTIAYTVATNAGSYSCVVSNSVWSTNSQAATLTVNVAPTITVQPANVTVYPGQPATFSVSATGTAPLYYQWQFGSVAIAGAMSSSYTIVSTAATNAGSYSCVVSNIAGSTNSQVATLTVNSAPTITVQPANVSVQVGQPATFSVLAVGTAPLYYQWQFGSNAIAGATNSSYTIASTVETNSGSYSCVVSNAYGSVTSSVVMLQASLILNNGFEMGDFTGWTLSGDNTWTIVDNGSSSGIVPHSGSYEAAFGTAGSLGYLSQTVPTTPGTSYLLSCWVNNAGGDPSYVFIVSWDGTTLLDETNPPAAVWTNYQFAVTASGTNTVLQFGYEADDAPYLDLDDVSLVTIQPPMQLSITSIVPNSGPTSGGILTTITGTGFEAMAGVNFGLNAAALVNVISATNLTALTPAGLAGAVNVVITNVDGSSFTLTNGFSYVGTIQPPVAYLQAQWLNQHLVLTWTKAGFILQAAPVLTGMFTNIPGAMSPYIYPITGSQQFFRLMMQ